MQNLCMFMQILCKIYAEFMQVYAIYAIFLCNFMQFYADFMQILCRAPKFYADLGKRHFMQFYADFMQFYAIYAVLKFLCILCTRQLADGASDSACHAGTVTARPGCPVPAAASGPGTVAASASLSLSQAESV